MNTSAIQHDDMLPTGRVSIKLEQGEPRYDIVYHGSLALRHPQSAKALSSLIDRCAARIYLDVNLRPPWWDKKAVLDMIKRAQWTKLNSDEFDQLYPGKASTIERLSQFVEQNQLAAVILTHGKRGAEVMLASGQHFNVAPQSNSDVIDTVGAGDAFSAVTLAGLVHNWPMELTLQRAQAFASELVSRRGATVSEPSFYQQIVANW